MQGQASVPVLFYYVGVGWRVGLPLRVDFQGIRYNAVETRCAREETIMPVFAYVAKDKAGKIHRGRAEADNEKMLTKRLQESGYWVSQITKEGGTSQTRKNPLLAFKKVKLDALSIFCRQFATMINAGVSLVRCLQVLETQAANPKLKGIIKDISYSF
jgi:type II secretory pathway component PulF